MEPILGQLIVFAGTFAPRGWALCNGQLLSISQNTALFSILGTTYGGDGRINFALPDLRGRVASHVNDDNALLTISTQGDEIGTETNVLNITQLPSHGHAITGNVNVAASTTSDEDSDSPIDNYLRSTPGTNSYASTADTTMSPSQAILGMAVAGSATPAAINNIQPTLVFNYCIALEGIFPQRQ